MITPVILKDETIAECNHREWMGVIKFYLPAKSHTIDQFIKKTCVEPEYELCELKEHIYKIDNRYALLSIYISSQLHQESENREQLISAIINKHCAYLYTYAVRGKEDVRI